ncbi:hypothetical protein PSHT_16554, partial [Puccinia striiformis]
DDDVTGSDWTALWLAFHPISRFFLRLVHVIRLIHQGRSPLHSSGQPQTCRLTVLLGSVDYLTDFNMPCGQVATRRNDTIAVRSSVQSIYSKNICYLLGRCVEYAKAIELERTKPVGQYTFLEIPRARRFAYGAFPLNQTVYHLRKQGAADLGVVILNGPGSSVPIALSVFLPRVSISNSNPLGGEQWERTHNGVSSILYSLIAV